MRDTPVSGMEDVSHPRLLPGALKGGRQLMSVAVISSTGHVYRQQKVSAGRRTIRKQRYPIQPHDIVIYKGRKYETSECHNNGTRAILLPDKKNRCNQETHGLLFFRWICDTAIKRKGRSRRNVGAFLPVRYSSGGVSCANNEKETYDISNNDNFNVFASWMWSGRHRNKQ